ncbi:MAG: DUF4147 domain-containing protein, partial [Candidatus Eisenbacteria bacterium]|nr:DUF4147 domain-containing protein [Candidatus Eisenbacteria bacterium]
MAEARFQGDSATEAGLRAAALEIFRRALDAVDGFDVVFRAIHADGSAVSFRAGAAGPFPIFPPARVRVVGAGKASGYMAAAVEAALRERVFAGVVCVPRGRSIPLERIELIEGGHPLPDAAGTRGARAIRRLLRETRPRDLVVNLVSGGGSALLLSL